MSDAPNPGSDEAVEQGCCCPRMDNAYGRGAWGSSEEDAFFFIAKCCSVHGWTVEDDEVTKDG